MTFERTRSGLSNKAAFLGVDFICYVEGGGGVSEFSEDVGFWKSLFSVERPDLKVHFSARGGKPELEARARDIVAKNIQHSLVALDADYDHLLGEKISDSRVLYTWGYSWENDIATPEMIQLLYAHFIGANVVPASERTALSDEVAEVFRALLWPMRADFCALLAKTSVLPRQSAGRIFFPCPQTGAPKVNRSEVLRICREANSKRLVRGVIGSRSANWVPRDCPGKIWIFFAAKIISFVSKKHGRGGKIDALKLKSVGSLLWLQHKIQSPTAASVLHHSKSLSAIQRP